jgi:hypothetical protein
MPEFFPPVARFFRHGFSRPFTFFVAHSPLNARFLLQISARSFAGFFVRASSARARASLRGERPRTEKAGGERG